MARYWSSQSLRHLADVHDDLRKVCDLALQISPFDFRITDGDRTIAEQRDNVAKGVSQTMNSRHIGGYAIDYVALVDGRATYAESAMRQIADAFKAASNQLDIPIEWGGDWKSFHDTPHIQLARSRYPDA